MKRYLPEHLTQNLPTNNDLTSWVPFFEKIHVSEKLLRESFADTPLPNLQKLYENCAPGSGFHTDNPHIQAQADENLQICPYANWQLYALTEDLAFIEKLLDFSTQPIDCYGRTILDYAAYSGSPDAITAVLEKFPELAQHTTKRGNNILHYAAWSGSPDAITTILKKFPELAKKTNNFGGNILHFAAQSGSPDAINTILKELPELAKKTDEYRGNILHYAAKSGSPDAIKTILKKLPELVQTNDYYYKTVLDYASAFCSSAFIIALLEEFPELAKKKHSSSNDFLLRNLVIRNFSDAITYICDKFPQRVQSDITYPYYRVNNTNILHIAARMSTPNTIITILEKFPELTKFTYINNLNILQFLVFKKDDDTATYILDKFPELLQNTLDTTKKTLHLCLDRPIIFKLIIKSAPDFAKKHWNKNDSENSIHQYVKNNKLRLSPDDLLNEVLNETLLAINKNTPPTEKQIALINAFHQEVDDYLKNKDNKIPADELKRLKKGKKAFDLLKIENLPRHIHTIALQRLEGELNSYSSKINLFRNESEKSSIKSALTELIDIIKSTKLTIPFIIQNWGQQKSIYKNLTNAELIDMYATNSTKRLIKELGGPAPKPKSIEFDL